MRTLCNMPIALLGLNPAMVLSQPFSQRTRHMHAITTIAELEAIYGQPGEASTAKVATFITPHYRAFIEAAPFCALATSGPEGLDCTPRGDAAGALVRVQDERTLLMPDRRGNKRIDSLKNIVRDPRVALLFLIPGSQNALRVNGRAQLSAERDVLASFAVDGKAPRIVIVIGVEAVYFQCGRAIVRADLWNPLKHVADGVLPSAGEILADLSDGRMGGAEYDRGWAERAKGSLW